MNLYYLHLLPGLRAEVVTWRPYVNRRSPPSSDADSSRRHPTTILLVMDSTRCHPTTILPTLLGSLYTAGQVRNGRFYAFATAWPTTETSPCCRRRFSRSVPLPICRCHERTSPTRGQRRTRILGFSHSATLPHPKTPRSEDSSSLTANIGASNLPLPDEHDLDGDPTTITRRTSAANCAGAR